MRIIVMGDRNWYRPDLAEGVLNRIILQHGPSLVIVHGGAGLCLAFHRAISSSRGTKDCARRAIAAAIPTYLIASDAAEPKRLVAGDARLK